MRITRNLSKKKWEYQKSESEATSKSRKENKKEEEKISEKTIRDAFSHAEDVIIQSFILGKKDEPILLTYCKGLADSKQIYQYYLNDIETVLNESKSEQEKSIKLTKRLPLRPLSEEETLTDIIYNVFSGEVALYFMQSNKVFFLSVSDEPKRSPEESNTEISLRGPKDGFTEDYDVNVALVRKRLRTDSLYNETFKIGSRSHTKISLLYVNDVVDKEIVDEARRRIKALDTDLLDSSQKLEELLADRPYSIFPLTEFAGRPDYVAHCINRGRIAIVIGGVPNAIIAPANFTTLLRTPEDLHAPYHFVSFEIMLRFLGLFLSIFAPGFYIAVTTYHVEQIPFTMLTTIGMSRFGLPFSIPLETFFMLIILELFREAVVRLAKPVGQTVAVVGGLIIGDAAIQGGLASPTLLVVIALAMVGTFTLVNQSLNGTVTLLRIFCFFLTSFLGIFGFLTSMLFILVYMSNLESFKIPYLSTGGSTHIKELLGTFGRLPWKMMKKRPSFLDTKDKTRRGEST